MRILDHPSPNHGPRPPGAEIALVLLHYTGMRDAASALARLCDPESGVSCHYLVEEDGTVRRLVAEERRAWHAGRGAWRSYRDVNDVSIGIELVNPGHEWGYRPFPTAQIASLCELLEGLLRRHRLGRAAVIGHSDVAPTRKSDPGELFPWSALAARGLALWPEGASPRPVDPLRARTLLRRIGYVPAFDGASLATLLRAFQRRFRPRRVDGTADAETMGLLEVVAALSTAPPHPRFEDGFRVAGRPLPRRRGRKVRAPREHGAG